MVQAERENGKSAVGEQTSDLDHYLNNLAWSEFKVQQKFDIGWKILITVLLVWILRLTPGARWPRNSRQCSPGKGLTKIGREAALAHRASARCAYGVAGRLQPAILF